MLSLIHVEYFAMSSSVANEPRVWTSLILMLYLANVVATRSASASVGTL